MQLPRRRAGLTAAVALVALLAFVGAAVLTVLLLARPAGAVLVTAAPAHESSADRAPEVITLTFSAALAEAHIEVSGASTEDDWAAVDGATATKPVTITAEGHHLVTYHVVTADGGEAAGTLWFTVGDAGGAPPPEPQSGHLHGDLDAFTAVMIGVNVVAMIVFAGLFLMKGRRARR